MERKDESFTTIKKFFSLAIAMLCVMPDFQEPPLSECNQSRQILHFNLHHIYHIAQPFLYEGLPQPCFSS